MFSPNEEVLGESSQALGFDVGHARRAFIVLRQNGDRIAAECKKTIIRLQRQIERYEILVEELAQALDSVGSHEIPIKVSVPKSMTVEADQQLLDALLCALRDCN